MYCSQCQTYNKLTNRLCARCATPLAPARAIFYLDQAESCLEQSLDLCRFYLAKMDGELLALATSYPGRSAIAARAAWLQARIHQRNGHHDDALAELLLAHKLLEGESGQERLLADILNLLGTLAYVRDEAATASEYYRQCVAVARSVSDHAMTARALGNLGIISMDGGAVAAAVDLFNEGLREAELSGDATNIAFCSRGLALLYSEHGPASEAVSCIERALALRDQVQDTTRLLLIIADASDVFFNIGDLDRAEQCSREAYALSQRAEGKYMQDAVLVSIADINRRRGNLDACKVAANRAFHAPAGSAIWRAQAAAMLARVAILQRNSDQARKQIAWLRYHDAENETRLALLEAMLAATEGQWLVASQHFAAARSVLDQQERKLDLADALENYAHLLLIAADGEVRAEASRLLHEAASIYIALEMPLRLAAVETLVG